MPVITGAALAGATLGVTGASAGGGAAVMAGISGAALGAAAGAGAKYAVKEAKDMFSPDLPEVETPDPVAQQAGLGTAQATERAMQSKRGLQTTKVVQQSLLKQRGREKLGSTSV